MSAGTPRKMFVNNAHLTYVDEGPRDALPVVFLHGFPFSHAMWTQQIDVLKSTFRAIAYDLRGHGQSDIGDGQYSIEGHVDDLLALLDTLAIEKAVIVGLSMGGYVTLRALERNPERFLATVLCDTRSESDSNEVKVKRYAGVRTVKETGSESFADSFVKMVFAATSSQRVPEAVHAIHTTIRRTPPLSIAGTLLALAARTDTTESLSRIKIPTLILVGEQDVVTPPDAARALHERITGSELYLIPDAGHMANLENPQAFNGHLLAFLSKVVAGNQSKR